MYGTGVSFLDVITMLNKKKTKFTLIQEHFYNFCTTNKSKLLNPTNQIKKLFLIINL